MICLDTNVAIGLLNEKPAVLVTRFWQAVARDRIALPVIALSELQFGVVKSAQTSTKRAAPRPILRTADRSLAVRGLRCRARRGHPRVKRKGTPIGPYDTLIATQALRHYAILVTANTREFARVPGLMLEDWTR